MHQLAEYQRPAFLGDHPPVLARMIMESDGTETVCLAGSVLGRDSDGKLGLWTSDSAEVSGILAGDVTVPASGGASVDVYIHASVAADALIFADGVSAEDEKTCLAALREKGIYSSVTWAPAKASKPDDQNKQENSNNDDQDLLENSNNGGGE